MGEKERKREPQLVLVLRRHDPSSQDLRVRKSRKPQVLPIAQQEQVRWLSFQSRGQAIERAPRRKQER